MKFDVWLVKSSRKPVLYELNLLYPDALISADLAYQTIKNLQKHDLAANGISVQIVSADHCDYCSGTEIGGFAPELVTFQIGAY